MKRRLPTGFSFTLALSALGSSVLAYAHWVERTRVSLDRYEVQVNKPGIPPRGLTILHLSDFHFRKVDTVQARRLSRLRHLLRGQYYDVVALTGDLIHDQAGLAAALAFLHELHPRICAFAVPGNRDYWQSSFRAVLGTPEERAALTLWEQTRLVTVRVRGVVSMFLRNERSKMGVRSNDISAMYGALEHLGIQPLVNRSVRIRGEGIDITFAGTDDLGRGDTHVEAALDGVPLDRPLVLLTHNPDVWLEPLARRADLVLAGHTHGGQIRLPVLGAWYRQGTHLPRSQPAGWFESEASTLFVTRGLGESFPFRLGARPQAALIRLVSTQGL